MSVENSMFIRKIKDKAKNEGALEELDLVWNSLVKGRTKCLVREELAQFLESEKEKLEVKKQ